MKKYLKIFLIFTVVLACIFSTVSCTEAPEDNGTSESTVSDTPTETDGSSDTTSEATETVESAYVIEIPERYANTDLMFDTLYKDDSRDSEYSVKNDFRHIDMMVFFSNNPNPSNEEFKERFGKPHAYHGTEDIVCIYITSDGYIVYAPWPESPKSITTFRIGTNGKSESIDESIRKYNGIL